MTNHTLINPHFLAYQQLTDIVAGRDDMSEYWNNANQALTKGYTLPVPHQNALDDINGIISDAFKHNGVDISTLDAEKLQALVDGVDLSGLNRFVIRDGVDHHYHCTAGTGKDAFKLEMDLKVVPTIHDQLKGPLAALGFIAVKVTTGDVYTEGSQDVKVMYAKKVMYLGSAELEPHHAAVISGSRHAEFTSHVLGCWLFMMRNVNYAHEIKAIGAAPLL